MTTQLQALTYKDLQDEALASYFRSLDATKLYNILFDHLTDANFDKFSSYFDLSSYNECYDHD